MLTLSSSQFDPLYGPAVRCKRFVELAVSGLASMYPVSSWSCFAPDHHGYQRACDLINGQASTGHLGHQCSHAPGRPILHFVLSSRRPRLETVDRVTSSLARYFAQFLCSSQGSVPSSRPAERRSRRAQGRSRPAVALGLRLAPALPGALTAPSTARGSSGSDAYIVSPRQLEGASFSQHRPGDAGKLVGERDSP